MRLGCNGMTIQSADPIGAHGIERRDSLRRWFRTNRRSFPWRNEPDAWKMLLAEFLLRRTRADHVATIFPRLIALFPSPAHVASVSLSELQQELRPVGLIGRATQLRETAAMLVNDFGGKVPTDESDLQVLPGVGPYVAGAIVSGTSRRKVLLVDTNTVRVSIRVAGITVNASDIRRQRSVVDAVADLLDGPATGRDWWAVIDLAALVCRPTAPVCYGCPLAPHCLTGQAALSESVTAGRYDQT